MMPRARPYIISVSAGPTNPVVGAAATSGAIAAPHRPQNRASGATAAPHCLQNRDAAKSPLRAIPSAAPAYHSGVAAPSPLPVWHRMNHAPTLGINFSHRHAAWLGLDPDALFAQLLDELGARHVRLSVYWDEIAPGSQGLDFAPVRRWLDPLEARGGRALVTVGLKAQRWPEFYPPDWLLAEHPVPNGALLDDHPRVIAHLLLMLERVTAFLADYDAVDAWQVENEPFLPSMRHTVGWRISPDLLAREVAVVREADPRRRPVVINHSTQYVFDRRWRVCLDLADAYAENIYTRKPNRWPWQI